MQCYSPLRVNQKGQYILVPCGKCNFCLQNKRVQWAFRNNQELKDALTAHFITLTYDEEHLPTERDRHDTFTYVTLKKNDLIKFHKHLKTCQTRALMKIRKERQLRGEEYKRLKKKWRIKYYSTGEYGTKRKRPHYHCLIFNLHPYVIEKLEENKLWTKGNIHFGDVNQASINYVSKYLIDKDETQQGWDERQQPFALMSKGIGIGYLRKKHYHKARGDHITEYRYYCLDNGHKVKMPRYYKEKIFSKIEREIGAKQAMQRQDEETEKRIQQLELEHGDRQTAVMRYNEQIDHQYNSIRIKSLKLNSL
ncbi:MAG: replication initiator protein [Microviridae sp.]|nr:MAG: replication initiator protein [Microviridae sp.]